jgi:hypothetical protein
VGTLSSFLPPQPCSSLAEASPGLETESRMCTIVDTDVFVCPVPENPGELLIFVNPMVQNVRPVTGMELGQKTEPNPSASRSVEPL